MFLTFVTILGVCIFFVLSFGFTFIVLDLMVDIYDKWQDVKFLYMPKEKGLKEMEDVCKHCNQRFTCNPYAKDIQKCKEDYEDWLLEQTETEEGEEEE